MLCFGFFGWFSGSDAGGHDFVVVLDVAVGALEFTIVTVHDGAYGCAGDPVEVEGFFASGAGKPRGVVGSVSWEHKKDYNKAYCNDDGEHRNKV
jgi:hypothetical protein